MQILFILTIEHAELEHIVVKWFENQSIFIRIRRDIELQNGLRWGRLSHQKSHAARGRARQVSHIHQGEFPSFRQRRPELELLGDALQFQHVRKDETRPPLHFRG